MKLQGEFDIMKKVVNIFEVNFFKIITNILKSCNSRHEQKQLSPN